MISDVHRYSIRARSPAPAPALAPVILLVTPMVRDAGRRGPACLSAPVVEDPGGVFTGIWWRGCGRSCGHGPPFVASSLRNVGTDAPRMISFESSCPRRWGQAGVMRTISLLGPGLHRPGPHTYAIARSSRLHSRIDSCLANSPIHSRLAEDPSAYAPKHNPIRVRLHRL